MDGFVRASHVPENSEASIVTWGENRIVEIVPTYIFDFSFMENEVAHGSDTVLRCFMDSVPYREFPIVTACSNLHVIIFIPFQGKPFSLMSF